MRQAFRPMPGQPGYCPMMGPVIPAISLALAVAGTALTVKGQIDQQASMGAQQSYLRLKIASARRWPINRQRMPSSVAKSPSKSSVMPQRSASVRNRLRLLRRERTFPVARLTSWATQRAPANRMR